MRVGLFPPTFPKNPFPFPLDAPAGQLVLQALRMLGEDSSKFWTPKFCPILGRPPVFSMGQLITSEVNTLHVTIMHGHVAGLSEEPNV